MIFGTLNFEKIWHEMLQISPDHLSDVATLPWEIEKSHCQQYYSCIIVIICVISEEKNCNPLAHPAWKYHHTNLWIAKLFHLTEGLLRSFKTLEAVKRASCGLSSVALKPVVTCGNWNVWQAMSQQVFRLTTFCVNTCFQSFSTLISRIVNHTVLKFSPCGNKPSPQASTCPYQYTRSSCSVLQTQY